MPCLGPIVTDALVGRDLRAQGEVAIRLGRGHNYSFAYSALACFRMGMSGSASSIYRIRFPVLIGSLCLGGVAVQYVGTSSIPPGKLMWNHLTVRR
jgi:hypothetical protein